MTTTDDFIPESQRRRVLDSITRKTAARPKVDANGNPIDPSTLPTYEYDAAGLLVSVTNPTT